MMGPVQNEDPIYRAMVAAFTADKRNRVIPSYGIRRKVIDLSVAAVEQEFKVPGDFVYCDYNSTGVALCSLNNTSEDAFPLLALAGVQNIPFDGLYLTWSAQPGLVLNLWYGYNSQFISPTSAIATIGSIVNPVDVSDRIARLLGVVQGQRAQSAAPQAADQSVQVRELGAPYGASTQSITTVAANGTITLVPVASNTGGMILWDAENWSRSGTPGHKSTIVAANAAPATVINGDVIVGMNDYTELAAVGAHAGKLQRPVYIAAGKGLFQISDTIETHKLTKVLYTLL